MCIQVRWSYGVRLLSQADPEPVQVEAEDAAEAAEASPLVSPDEAAFPPSSAEERILHHDNLNGSDDTQTLAPTGNPGLSVEEVDGRKFFYSFPNTPSSRSAVLPQVEASGTTTEYEDNDEDSGAEGELPPGRRIRTAPTSTLWQSRRRRVKRRLAKAFKTFRSFMTVPLWAALASLVVACIQPLQHALDDHLPPVKGAIASLGDCSIPITLVVLGAYFYTPPESDEERQARARALPEHNGEPRRSASRTSLLENVREMFAGTSAKGKNAIGASASKEARPGETKTVVVAILSRMIITPLLLMPLMTVSTAFDLQKVFDECVFALLFQR